MSTAAAEAEKTGPIVQTLSGKVEGVASQGEVTAFLGLPYAAAPVNEYRWRAPSPAPEWIGVRPADRHAPICMQPSSPWEPDAEPAFQSEDCLYLNVWTPAANTTDRLPVMVWFHGGGFMVGSGSDERSLGDKLAQDGVVVVTVNYRLGPLGFLVLDELNEESLHETSGNYGLLDQIAALRWVKNNIEEFGGNPDNVTIFGFSAGSTAVNALQASPLARGLFHKAIGQSTANMNPAAGIWNLRSFAEAEQYGKEFQRSLGADTLADLRALPAKTLVNSPYKFWLIEGDGYVLPDEIHEIFARGDQAAVPVLAGATANEETTLASADQLSWLHARTPEDEAAFTHIYGEQGVHNDRSVSDVILWQMREWVRLNKRIEPNSYLYFFDHAPPNPIEGLGAYHGAEIPYVFKTFDVFDWPWIAQDRELGNLVSRYWTNFAKAGDPNGPGLRHWPAFTEGKVMELSSSPGLASLPRAEVLELLDAYFARERARPAAPPHSGENAK